MIKVCDTYLFVGGRTNSQQQTPTPDRTYDLTRTTRTQHQAQIAHILFHRPPQCALRIPAQRIRLVDDYNFESVFRVQVDVLSLRNLFEDVLNDQTVIISGVGRGEFDVVVGGDNVDVDFAVGGCDKDALINLQLLARCMEKEDAGSVSCELRREEHGERGKTHFVSSRAI